MPKVVPPSVGLAEEGLSISQLGWATLDLALFFSVLRPVLMLPSLRKSDLAPLADQKNILKFDRTHQKTVVVVIVVVVDVFISKYLKTSIYWLHLKT